MNDRLRKSIDDGVTPKRELPPISNSELSINLVIKLVAGCIGYASHLDGTVNMVDTRKSSDADYKIINDGTIPVSVTYLIEKGKHGILISDGLIVVEHAARKTKIAFIQQ